MPYLDAALAFALTMLVVATLVTQIVRVLKNTANVRRKGLEDMLKEYFKSEFEPVVQRELNRLTTTVSAQVFTDLNNVLKKFDASLQINKAVEEKLVDMSTDELTERLKRSDLGLKLLADLGDKAQAVFDELGKRYEVVGKKFTESFRSKSRVWATGIALILALAINIDSIYIANVYIKNESMRQAVIAQKDAFVEDYNALAETLENEKVKDSFTKAELEKAFKDSREQLNVVTSSGFPVGWSYFPYSYFEGTKDNSRLSQDFKNRDNPWGWFTWVLGILLTTALAGLGGPFWYDVVARISRAVQSVRAAAGKPDQS